MHGAVARQRLLFSLAFCSTQMAVHCSGCQHETNPQSAQQQFTACPHQMFSSEGFILMHLPALPVLWPQIRIIRCIQTSGTFTDTHTRAHTLARFKFPSLSCLYHSQLASGQLCSPEHRKNRKKKNPLYFD